VEDQVVALVVDAALTDPRETLAWRSARNQIYLAVPCGSRGWSEVRNASSRCGSDLVAGHIRDRGHQHLG